MTSNDFEGTATVKSYVETPPRAAGARKLALDEQIGIVGQLRVRVQE